MRHSVHKRATMGAEGWTAERCGFDVVIAFKVPDFGASDAAVGIDPNAGVRWRRSLKCWR